MRIFTGTCSTECATRHKQKPEYPGNWHNFMTSYRFGLDVGANSLGWCVLALREQASRFQSTRPRRGATFVVGQRRTHPHVSIHAPPKGRDRLGNASPSGASCFNPRAPEGARLMQMFDEGVPDEFQSTRPRRGATECPRCNVYPSDVSIHAPPKGRDVLFRPIPGCKSCFNPRALEGARPRR